MVAANKLSERFWVQITFHVPPEYAKLTDDVVKAIGESGAEVIRDIMDEYLLKPIEPTKVLERAAKGKANMGRKGVKAYLLPNVVVKLNSLCEEWSCHRNQLYIEALEIKAHQLKKEGKLQIGGMNHAR